MNKTYTNKQLQAADDYQLLQVIRELELDKINLKGKIKLLFLSLNNIRTKESTEDNTIEVAYHNKYKLIQAIRRLELDKINLIGKIEELEIQLEAEIRIQELNEGEWE